MIIFSILFFSLSLAAVVTKYRLPEAYKFAKPLPLALLIAGFGILFPTLSDLHPVFIWALFGILCGLGGDVLLLNNKTFLLGLASFLFGHICYTVVFFTLAESSINPVATTVVAAAVIVYGVFLVRHLLLNQKKHYVFPVAFYLIAIGLMVNSAMSHSPWIITGALLFALSDAVLAINRFVMPFQAAQAVILPAYYSAQFFIFTGLLRLTY